MKDGSGNDARPVATGDCEVLADRAGSDRMPFLLKLSDDVERKDHDGTVGAAVMTPVTLDVAVEAFLGDQRFEQRQLRNAAAGDVGRFQASAHGVVYGVWDERR